MPTPRQHKGAQLTTFPLTAPGFKGLNLSAQNSLLPPEWATKLQNALIDNNGRLAARKGWVSQTTGTPVGYTGTHDGAADQATLSDSGESWTTDEFVGQTIYNTTDGSSGTITGNTATTVTATLAGGTDNDWDTGDAYVITQPFGSMIEYITHSGTVELIGCTPQRVWRSTDDGVSWTNVTGTAVFTSGNWDLHNFNDLVIGFQSGETPLLFNGTTCSQITDGGSEPDGGVGLSAFGRLWAADANGYELKYCALLDHTDWSGADAGSFDLRNVWPGTDTIMGLAEHNGALIVFGERNILIYVDGSGSALGMDPTNMYVVDTIAGLGTVTHQSIQAVGGDLWFLGNDYNIHSLQRVVQEKSQPIANLSTNISDDLRNSITLTGFTLANLRTLYSPENRFYLLFLPQLSAGAEVGTTWVFDTRGTLEDGTARCMGRWTDNVGSGAVVARENGDLFWQLSTVDGEIGLYTGHQDNGNSYTFEWNSGWMDITKQSYEIIIKRLTGLFYVGASTTIQMKWAWDFQSTFDSQNLTFTVSGAGAEWGLGEWNSGEFSGGVSLREKNAQGKGTGEFIKVGVQTTIDGASYAMQHVDLYAKVGRLR